VIEIATDGDWVVVRLAGEIDMASAPAIRETLDSLEDAGYTKLRLDLGSVTFMDSQGLNALARAAKRAHELDGVLVASNPTEPVRRIMELTGLDRLLATTAVAPGSPAA
jgi:anti-sigma B factor antagonist